jgi:hypothetical protein
MSEKPARTPNVRRRRLKLVLLSILVVGTLGSITVPRVYALLTGEESNMTGKVSTGTLTMENTNAGDSASTTLADKVGVTTLAASVGQTYLTNLVGVTTLGAAVTTTNGTSITVSSSASFPADASTSNPFFVKIDNEQMKVTAVAGNTWTVVRAQNGTTGATHLINAAVNQVSISVASATGFPASGSYTIQVDSEQMTVTGGQGTTTWNVTRAANLTTAAAHTTGAEIDPTTISVAAATSFPSTTPFKVQVDNEQMTVTGIAGTTFTVTRGVNGTNPASHANGANVNQVTITVASATGFPASARYTVLVDSERMKVVSGPGCNPTCSTTWTVVRGTSGTSAASHASGAAIGTSACQSIAGTSNVNTGCDAAFVFSPGAENYPGDSVVTPITLKNTGSIKTGELDVWMPTCLRGITPDSPLASTTPSISSFSGFSTSGGNLANGTTYYYELTAVISGTETVAGAEASYTPSSGTTNDQITLNWTAVPGASSYKIYRGTSQGGEQLLDTTAGTSYADTTNASPSGNPPSGTGSGNPCGGGVQFYLQETTDASGSSPTCWYPSAAGACSFSGVQDLSLFYAFFNGTSVLNLGSGPTSTNSRYFQIGIKLPSTADNTLQETEALFNLRWAFQQ